MTDSKKDFYRQFFSIVIPIALQNLISSAVGVADTLMLGYVDQTALAAGSLAGQIMMILNMVYFGIGAGITMLVAQYWGKGDMRSIEKVLGIGLKFSLGVGLLFFAGAFFFPELLMLIYTDDANMIAAGAQYLEVVSFSYLFLALSQPYLAAMKSIEQVKTSTLINSSALVLNVVLNAVFIFGWIPGIPPMGIQGIALATVIARLIEFALCIIAGERYKKLRLRPRLLTLHSTVLMKDFIRLALPAIGNDFVWGLAYSMSQRADLGRRADDVFRDHGASRRRLGRGKLRRLDDPKPRDRLRIRRRERCGDHPREIHRRRTDGKSGARRDAPRLADVFLLPDRQRRRADLPAFHQQYD